MFGRTPLTPAEQLAKDQRKAQKRREQAAYAARQAEARQERLENMPHFVVRQTREVTVKCENMGDAIALASAAFKEGQSADHTIKWSKPFGVDGDTVDAIRVIDIKSKQVYDFEDGWN